MILGVHLHCVDDQEVAVRQLNRDDLQWQPTGVEAQVQDAIALDGRYAGPAGERS